MNRLCIVEDERSVLNLIVDLLSHTYAIIDFNNPLEAWEFLKIHSNSIDLLITDINMPGLTGIELGKLVKEINSDIKILYMSGYVGHTGKDLSGENFIYKPFTLSELKGKIEETLNN